MKRYSLYLDVGTMDKVKEAADFHDTSISKMVMVLLSAIHYLPADQLKATSPILAFLKV